jgi:hypothetical protein
LFFTVSYPSHLGTKNPLHSLTMERVVLFNFFFDQKPLPAEWVLSTSFTLLDLI